MKREDNWFENYSKLKTYIERHGQLPAKQNVEDRALLNWWKYNRKRIKRGTIEADKAQMLIELGNSRLVHR